MDALGLWLLGVAGHGGAGGPSGPDANVATRTPNLAILRNLPTRIA